MRNKNCLLDYLNLRLIKKQDGEKLVQTEFILLLCPDERFNQQIRTFTSESFRYLAKETSLKDRQHLRAFKLSSFFYVKFSSFKNEKLFIYLFN